MKNTMVFVFCFSTVVAFSVPAQAVPLGATKIVSVGCTVPSATAPATVYSVDNKDRAGATIALPAQVKNGASCSAALNAMQTTTSGCYTRWTLVNGPTNFTMGTTGYSLVNYIYQCTTI